MRDLQSADLCECRGVLTAVGNFGEMALEEASVGFEAITLPHFDKEEVLVVLLSLLTRGVLSEEYFNYLFEVVEKRGGRE